MRLDQKTKYRMMSKSDDLIKIYDQINKKKPKLARRILRELESRGMSTRLIKRY